MNIHANKKLDTTGLTCPLPVLKVKQTLKTMALGEVLHIVATDAGTTHDIPAFSKQTGHRLLDNKTDAGKYNYWLEKC